MQVDEHTAAATFNIGDAGARPLKVLVRVDLFKLARWYAKRAANNKERKATVVKGAVQVSIIPTESGGWHGEP
jgi:hypothetical protein